VSGLATLGLSKPFLPDVGAAIASHRCASLTANAATAPSCWPNLVLCHTAAALPKHPRAVRFRTPRPKTGVRSICRNQFRHPRVWRSWGREVRDVEEGTQNAPPSALALDVAHKVDAEEVQHLEDAHEGAQVPDVLPAVAVREAEAVRHVRVAVHRARRVAWDGEHRRAGVAAVGRAVELRRNQRVQRVRDGVDDVGPLPAARDLGLAQEQAAQQEQDGDDEADLQTENGEKAAESRALKTTVLDSKHVALSSAVSRGGDTAGLTIAWATWMLGITAARN